MKENSKAMYVTSKVKVSQEKKYIMNEWKKERKKEKKEKYEKKKNMSMRKVNSPVL
jgi:hypothetical protein